MRLSLKNIGKIETACVEIDGITVIAGENNTGKSTVGRALFAVFNSFYRIQDQIRDERIENVENLLMMANMGVTNRMVIAGNDVAREIVEQIELYRENKEAIEKTIRAYAFPYKENVEEDIVEERMDRVVTRIVENLRIPDTDIFQSILEKKLVSEFNGQVNNVFSDDEGKIVLTIKNQDIVISIEENHVKQVIGNIDLRTESVYLDDPFVLDEVRGTVLFYRLGRQSQNHRIHLREKLGKENNINLIDEIVVNNKLESVYQKISEVCSGDIVQGKRSLGYQRKNTDRVLDVKNLSTGLKTFVILKMLLLNGTIEYNGTIILDEPEIHLHPEWQLLFAELIVLIQKEFGVHVLLNTHSPYFLNAIEVYSAKYGIADQCRYYLASSQNDVSTIEDVTKHIDKIYQKLARPLQDLENERGRL